MSPFPDPRRKRPDANQIQLRNNWSRSGSPRTPSAPIDTMASFGTGTMKYSWPAKFNMLITFSAFPFSSHNAYVQFFKSSHSISLAFHGMLPKTTEIWTLPLTCRFKFLSDSIIESLFHRSCVFWVWLWLSWLETPKSSNAVKLSCDIKFCK